MLTKSILDMWLCGEVLLVMFQKVVVVVVKWYWLSQSSYACVAKWCRLCPKGARGYMEKWCSAGFVSKWSQFCELYWLFLKMVVGMRQSGVVLVMAQNGQDYETE